MTQCPLPCGLSLPFYPMRPTSGVRCTVAQLIRDLDSKQWAIQPKMNGDRADLGITEQGALIQNRHLGTYSFPVLNKHVFEALPAGTLLDGEVWNSNFYPFECLAYGSRLMLDIPVEWRIYQAKQVCETLGVDWMFETPTPEWVLANQTNKTWEGYVKKRIGSPYLIWGVEREADTWFKVKW
jgi:ATP-dependent DNA ligase